MMNNMRILKFKWKFVIIIIIFGFVLTSKFQNKIIIW
jgi:hypothetical protein